MLDSLTRARAIGIWFTAVVSVTIAAGLLGAPLSGSTAVFLGLTCLVPPAVMLMVWRGPAPPTVAETINSVDRRR